MRRQAVAVAAIHADELLARRLHDRIAARGSVLRHPPPWLNNIGEIQITDVAEMVHILDDGDNVYIGWRWPNRSAAIAFLAYTDHKERKRWGQGRLRPAGTVRLYDEVP